jgi:hypothetical protein
LKQHKPTTNGILGKERRWNNGMMERWNNGKRIEQ